MCEIFRTNLTNLVMALSTAPLMRQFVRHASKIQRGSDKIKVQLLKDFQPLGVAGEIVRVRPAFMRNFLHVDNKACYITKEHGPRIPVVEKPKVVEPKKVKVVETVSETVVAEAQPAMSLEELTSLFSTMKNRRSEQPAAAFAFESLAEQIAYSLEDLEESLPSVFNLASTSVELPVTKESLVEIVYKSTGIQVPAGSIKVTTIGEKLSVLLEITKAGEYHWTFSAPGEHTTLKRVLKVH